jgi:hypothetical protein
MSMTENRATAAVTVGDVIDASYRFLRALADDDADGRARRGPTPADVWGDVGGVPSSRLRSVAQRYLQRQGFVRVVGDEVALLPAGKASLARVEVMDGGDLASLPDAG